MALERAKKSVIFHQGMSDGTDRFLLEPPSLDYAENLRTDKQGSLQKRPGFGPDELTTVPNASGEPFLIHSIDNSIHVLTEDGAKSYANGSWSETDVAGFVGTKEMSVETPPVGGLGHIDAIQTTVLLSGDKYWSVAYEVREKSSSVLGPDGNGASGEPTATPKHVIVQSYDSDGNFLHQVRIDNARSPKLTEHAIDTFADGGWPFLFYQDTADDKIKGVTWFAEQGTIGAVLDSGLVCNKFAGTEVHSNKAGALDQSMYFTRLGASSDGHARFHVSTLDPLYHVLYSGPGGNVEVVTLDSLLAVVSNATVSVGDGPGVSTIMAEALDVLAVETVGTMVMYMTFYTDDPNYWSEIRVGRFINGVEIWNFTVFTGKRLTFCHGGLAANVTSGDILYMFHDSGPSTYDQAFGSADPKNVRGFETGISYGTSDMSDGSSKSALRGLPGHRLCTRPIYDGDEIYAGVQKWYDPTVMTDVFDAFNAYANVLGAVKPTTTALCKFDIGANKVSPVAYFDAGSSRFAEAAEAELVTHIPRLHLIDGDFYMPNRLAIYAEDASMWIGDYGANFVRLGAAESGAEAQVRIHRVSKGVRSGLPIYASKFGDGIVASTAVPLWYDGKFFAEFGPLDAPEIIRIEDHRANEKNQILPQGFGPDDKGTSNWRKLAVLVGYYDARGNKHRSEPSSTVYLGNMYPADGDISDNGAFATNWRGREVTVYFTWPLSLIPSDLEYFIEVYGSAFEDDDMQLIDASTIKRDVTPSVYGTGVKATVQLMRWKAGINAGTIENPTRTSRPLYTQGGDLGASPWPSFNRSVVTSTRLFALDAVNKGRVLISKLFEDFISPEYNGALEINLGDERTLTAIGKIDDKVVVFEKDDIHVIYGDGPDNKGQGQDFAVHYISTDVGCEDQESVIDTPAGMIFYSKPRGFYMLDRNLQVKFIGAGIENLARDIDIVAATLVRDKSEARFVFTGGPTRGTGPDPDITVIASSADRPPRPVFTNVTPVLGGTALSYNYERDTWMLYTNYDAAAATIHQGKYTMLRNDWSIWQESETRFDDPTGINNTTMRTPWIRLSEQVQGFNRIWRMTFLGRYMSSLQDMGGGEYEASDIIVRVYYDYESKWSEEKRIRFQDFGYDPFNNPPKRAERFQFEIEPSRGRCQAIKLEIIETFSSEIGEGLTYKMGHGFEIVSVDFDIGVSSMRTLIPARVKQ